MTHRNLIDVESIEKYYKIDKWGNVYSLRLKRYIKPVSNLSGYWHVYLSYAGRKWYLVRRLVAAKYIGPCPDNMETSHKDGDKNNNHYTNLEYISHSANILKSFTEHNRRAFWKGRERGPTSRKTKEIMAISKYKTVKDSTGLIHASIAHAANHYGINRRSIQRSIYNIKPVKKLQIQFYLLYA